MPGGFYKRLLTQRRKDAKEDQPGTEGLPFAPLREKSSYLAFASVRM
jgi:hypothetical protein